MPRQMLLLTAAMALLAGCELTPTADYCAAPLSGRLESAIDDAEARLSNGCEYHFDSYFQQLLAIAETNPDRDNKRLFSDHLVHVSDTGLISKRQAKLLYNRYFNVKFVSFTGDYNTCAQTCPVREQVVSDMKAELLDKEIGLLHASQDQKGFYRADQLLKETELVLEATCRACSSSSFGP